MYGEGVGEGVAVLTAVTTDNDGRGRVGKGAFRFCNGSMESTGAARLDKMSANGGAAGRAAPQDVLCDESQLKGGTQT